MSGINHTGKENLRAGNGKTVQDEQRNFGDGDLGVPLFYYYLHLSWILLDVFGFTMFLTKCTNRDRYFDDNWFTYTGNHIGSLHPEGESDFSTFDSERL